MGNTITLFCSNTQGNKRNNRYHRKVNVAGIEELLAAAFFDHVAAMYKGNHRNNENFITSDCVMMDCDNSHSENPNDWLLPVDVANRLPDCRFLVVYSKSHNRIKHEGEKNEESARPRFHLYFPLSGHVDTWPAYRALKNAVRAVVPELDKRASDSARFFYGVKNPTGETVEGGKCVDELMRELALWPKDDQQQSRPQTADTADTTETADIAENTGEPKAWPEQKPEYKPVSESRFDKLSVLDEIGQPIHKGEGHGELLRYALKALFAYGDTDLSYQLFSLRWLDYEGSCPDEHKQAIWTDAQKHFNSKHDWDWQQPSKKAVRNAEKLVAKLTGKEDKSLEDEPKKKPLTLRELEAAMNELSIQARLNLITREVEISDMPCENPFIPDVYRNADSNTRKKNNAKILPVFLTSYLRDKKFSFNNEFLYSGLDALTSISTFNPFREMLQAENWDRVDRVLPVARALHIDTLDYHYLAFFTKWLHQVISMSMNDNGRLANDFVLVLQGAQHIGKTSFFRKLAVDTDWFCEGATINVNDKDSVMRATRVLICELGELDATLVKEQAALKSFITNTFDTYRTPYGKMTQKYERRTAFCATVNPDEFLRDRTGSRRFAVIPLTEKADTDFIYNVMTPDYVRQMWRQVYETIYLVRGHENFRLDSEESEFSERQNARFTVQLDGEIELFDWFDWGRPVEEWHLYNTSEIIARTGETVSATRMGAALRSAMQKDSRIQKRRVGTKNLYLLPPKRVHLCEETKE